MIPIELLNTLEYADIVLDSFEVIGNSEIIYHGHLSKAISMTAFSIHGHFLHMRLEGEKFTGSFILEDGALRYFLPDTASYVYLPAERKVIPKALAASIDRSRKQKASKENCHILIPVDDPSICNEFISDYIKILLNKDDIY